ncbi:MAG TPA: hypothetical protein VGO48_10500 [Conexibacter sp.]|jgi:hypothetical protein|nr:hypothetical protein [Conexibacter sp.]
MTTAVVLAIGSGGLSGCVSTQDKNARAKLVADRTIEGRKPLWLGGRSRDLRVLHVDRVRGRHGGALVVTLRNRGTSALTDVPIVVGVRSAGDRRTELNGGRGLAWFQTHLPAIGAGETTTWIYTTRRALPPGRPYAVAGRASSAGTLPRIAATVERAPAARRAGARRRSTPAAVRVALANDSDVPQYGLQVYAVVRAHGRVIAAGTATVRHLGSRGRASARVALFGAPGRHAARVHALPTIFE